MEEIKSSFSGVNKIMEDYNSKVYIASFLSSKDGDDSWKSVVFNTKVKALNYIIDKIRTVLNGLLYTDKIIHNLFDSEKDTLYGLQEKYFEANSNQLQIKDIDDIINEINLITHTGLITYHYNITETEIE